MPGLRLASDYQRLAADAPFLVFSKIPKGATVTVRVEGLDQTNYNTDGTQLGAQLNVNQKYAIDYASQPNYDFGGITGIRNSGMVYAWTTDFPGGLRDLQKFVAPAWTAFSPAVEGEIVPRGNLTHQLDMPGSAGLVPSLAPENTAMLRIRRRGDDVITGEAIAAAPGVGPFTIQFDNADVVPGTLVIVASKFGGGTMTVRDSGYADPRTGLALLGGDVSTAVDSTIDYANGIAVVSFNAAAAGGTPTVVASETVFLGAVTNITKTAAHIPIVPGSFTSTSTTEDFSDNGDGTLTGDQGGSGVIDYVTGIYTLTYDTDSGFGAITVGYTYYSGTITPVTGEAVDTGSVPSVTGILDHQPIEVGSLVINATTEDFTDNGDGTLTGDAGGTGTIDYTTGAYTATYFTNSGAGPITADYSYYVGATVVASEQIYPPYIDTASGNTVNPYLVPGTVAVTSADEDFSDNGDGTLTGDNGGTGTINYATGAYTLTFGTNSGAGDVTIGYSYYPSADAVADYEATYNKMPVDFVVEYSVDAN